MSKSQSASAYELHTHPWPLQLPTTGDLKCPMCGLVVPVAIIVDDRARTLAATKGVL